MNHPSTRNDFVQQNSPPNNNQAVVPKFLELAMDPQ